jgi:uncharacterized damage-inducible protein DinB
MNTKDFEEIWVYQFWATERMFEHLSTLTKVPDKANALLCHIINAMDIWLSRLNKRKQRFGLFEVRDFKSNRDAYLVLRDELMTEIVKKNDLEELISYNSTEGQPYKSLRKEIYYHMSNHNAYHLAQINMLLSQSSLKPVSIDYIVFTRRNAQG